MTGEPRRPPLREAFATPDTKYRYVRSLFATIAARYDLITRLLSFGLDQRWKRRLVALAALEPGDLVLDVACGTGDLASLATSRGSSVCGLDLTHGMLLRAREKPRAHSVRWVVGDMGNLPLADRTVDVVTMGYGLRNAADLERALAEALRVLRPGGRLCSLDFDRPANAAVRGLFLAYLTVVGSALGLVLHGDPDTYRYIPASIRRYPGAASVRALMTAAGFDEARHVPLLGGCLAIHVARTAPAAVRGRPKS
jgi:demethylmenaquinone methyltransferase / 2-methoxy-6-polyprenyl-1,4-benzoquinol methylase